MPATSIFDLAKSIPRLETGTGLEILLLLTFFHFVPTTKSQQVDSLSSNQRSRITISGRSEIEIRSFAPSFHTTPFYFANPARISATGKPTTGALESVTWYARDATRRGFTAKINATLEQLHSREEWIISGSCKTVIDVRA